MYDATTLITERFTVNASVQLLVFQIATVLNSNVVDGDIGVESLQPLRDYLCTFYRPDHPCVVVHSGDTLLEATERIPLPLGNLSSDTRLALWKRPTLFVPRQE